MEHSIDHNALRPNNGTPLGMRVLGCCHWWLWRSNGALASCHRVSDVPVSTWGMPRKIGFVVLSSSGHEGDFRAEELMVHAPTVHGWRSARFCSYPQQITLQLMERSRVRKLQLLAHQYLISAKVEFHIGDSLPDPAQHTGPPCPLHRLGYVSLSDNEKTGYKARELKSVHVDAIGTYLRVTLHRNHANRYNYYSQVALVAINVLGDSLDANAFNTIPSREQLIEHYLHSTQLDSALDGTHTGKCESISPLDDLAFDMYQDPEVAHIIRLLDQRKQDAARQERFELARALKQAIADLQKVGERLGRYDVEKRSALEKEDYELARKRTEQMEEYRGKVYHQLQVHDLLDMAAMQTLLSTELSPSQGSPSQPALPIGLEGDQPDHHPAAQPRGPLGGPPPARQGVSKPRRLIQSPKKAKKAPPRRGGSERATPGPDPRSVSLASQDLDQDQPGRAGSGPHSDVPRIDVPSVPHEDRPLPALWRTSGPAEVLPPRPAAENSPGPSHSPGSPRASPTLPGGTSEAEPLSEQAQREAGLPLEVFGEGLVAGAYSKNWAHRERALEAVCDKLRGVGPGTSKEERRNLMRAAVFLVKRALLDKLSPVFQAALRLLALLLGQVIPASGLGRAELTHCLEQTWPSLQARSWDPARRVRATAVAFILDMAQWKEVRALQVVPAELSRPLKASSPARRALGRTELLEKALAQLGTERSGFAPGDVMKFCRAALEHGAAEVREAAVRVVLSVYRTHPAPVLQALPTGDAAARRSVLYKRLFDAFARLDGGARGGTPRGDAGPEDGEREREQIRSLQGQLAALKELTEKDSAEGPALDVKAPSGPKEAPSGPKEAPSGPKEAPSDPREAPQAGPPTEADKVSQKKLLAVEQAGVGDLDNLCIFCGKRDEAFTEDQLDLHYWKHCPMLRRCEECRQVVEIASLTEHLLGECESRARFSQCPRCSEALPTQELARHAQGPACNPPAPGKGSNHCPLCHNNFIPGEKAWKAHLMGREGCKQNSRRAVGSQTTQPVQGKAVGGARLRQAWSDGARSKAVKRTSRIPALEPRAPRARASQR
ncbi:centrosomal protein of 104 kDa isoform X2 [Gadus morhua]|uniref:centrosomal protein of 104 kDa isoform X2 n=1 Tax=Gadus morhua TaxID=8049 RepID=UPI0011B41FAF|nr:centrosomal protein of 104 kDa isoform X2 [Gadus morhua]